MSLHSIVIRTLNLLVTNQELVSLSVYLPGIDAGDIWDLPNDNIYFAEEMFSNSTTNVHACIPKALSKMLGIQTLTIGYTKDIGLAEEIAKEAGAKQLGRSPASLNDHIRLSRTAVIRTCPEGRTLNLNPKERAKWIEKGWQLVGQEAHKTLIEESIEQETQQTQRKEKSNRQSQKHNMQRELSEGYSEAGRLKASMQVGNLDSV